MKTLHAVTLRKRRVWVSVLSCVLVVTIVASLVAWPSAAAVEASSSLAAAWLATLQDKWVAFALWSALALAAFAPNILRSGGVIGALAGEAAPGRIVFWSPALPFRVQRGVFAVDASHPLRISLVDQTDMYPGIKYAHVLLESGDLAKTVKLDGKAPMFEARGVAELARHAGIALDVDASAAPLMREPDANPTPA